MEMERGTPTRYPGVYRINESAFVVRAKTTDPRTGKRKDIAKLFEGVSAHEAAQKRAELIITVAKPVELTKRVRVGDFARSWIESKALRLDSTTLKTYTDALENHVLPALGDFFYNQITSQDVQRWIDRAVKRGWSTAKRVSRGTRRDRKSQRAYSRHSVAVWLRTFRTMTRDAMVALDLPRDPTLRVSLPEAAVEPDEGNALAPEQLTKFLDAMRADFPQHHGLVVLLAYTGLRFCHASALRWDDWDEDAGVLRIQRKQVRGVIGAVTRKKRAPKQYPVLPELAEVLREHHKQLVATKAKGLDSGYMFPSSTGSLRAPSSLDKAWDACLTKAGIQKRFTVHGLRYTFTDLVRLANVDAVVRRALTGHVTEQMQRKYSSVGLEEKRTAVAGVLRLVPPQGGANGGTEPSKERGEPTQTERKPPAIRLVPPRGGTKGGTGTTETTMAG